MVQYRKKISLVALLPGLIVLLMSSCSRQQGADINKLLESYEELDKFSGTVLVAKGGEIFFQKSYGLANREWKQSFQDDTRFRIASVTKQFTAVLILQLAEAGKINLQNPLSHYLPYYRKDVGGQVTIHQLLTHTAGLAEYTFKSDFFSDVSKRQFTTREFVEKFCSDTLMFTPGTNYQYTNTGYYILGAIIEEVTDKDYATILRENILEVAGMENSGIESGLDISVKRAGGYNYSYGTYSNADYMELGSAVLSAGAMYATAYDLFLWDKALFSDKLLTAESRIRMMTPVMANYGYGVGITKFVHPELKKEMHFVFHQGAINGFRSMLTLIVNDDIVVILLCNNFDTDLNQISNAIFAILNDQPYQLAKVSIVEQMNNVLLKDGMAKAINFYQQNKDNEHFDINQLEYELNRFGYHLMNQGQLQDALLVFELNVLENAASSNAYDSYAEALMKNKQPAEAIIQYKRSIDLNPSNVNAVNQLKALQDTLRLSLKK
ncbi:serine hydrolase domain-containing protein [Gynurincola endophyticus]|uniref:serine hydrolase domain-containing protein n=1 Tax=Gynurincola endophyticus TaxID=2479004 RepID=UPI000F8EEA4B|nr:serine hydrolase domain-containing protein [Gynurincola endophyticus]